MTTCLAGWNGVGVAAWHTTRAAHQAVQLGKPAMAQQPHLERLEGGVVAEHHQLRGLAWPNQLVPVGWGRAIGVQWGSAQGRRWETLTRALLTLLPPDTNRCPGHPRHQPQANHSHHSQQVQQPPPTCCRTAGASRLGRHLGPPPALVPCAWCCLAGLPHRWRRRGGGGPWWPPPAPACATSRRSCSWVGDHDGAWPG